MEVPTVGYMTPTEDAVPADEFSGISEILVMTGRHQPCGTRLGGLEGKPPVEIVQLLGRSVQFHHVALYEGIFLSGGCFLLGSHQSRS